MTRSIALALALSVLGCHSTGLAQGTGGAAHRPPPSQERTPDWHVAHPSPPETSTAVDRTEVARGMNAFGAALDRRLSAQGNLVWSPASVAVALTMAYGGARGATRTQMRHVLHVGLTNPALHAATGDLLAQWNRAGGGTELDVANRVYADRSMELAPTYVALTRDRYGAPVEVLDMKGAPGPSADRINAWVSTETHGRIPTLVDTQMLADDPLVVLVDAVYFQGTWQTPFNRWATRDMPFTLRGGRHVQAPMMQVTHELGYVKLPDGTKVLRLPYGGGAVDMVVALPASPDGVGALERSVGGDTVAGWVHQMSEPLVEVHLPRFHVAPPPVLLGAQLRAMGMRLALSGNADLSGMSPSRAVRISQVVHRAFVDVDEHGTVAAAATAVVAPTGAAPPAPAAEVNADHPFLFFIRDSRSGAILFWGRLADPTAS